MSFVRPKFWFLALPAFLFVLSCKTDQSQVSFVPESGKSDVPINAVVHAYYIGDAPIREGDIKADKFKLSVCSQDSASPESSDSNQDNQNQNKTDDDSQNKNQNSNQQQQADKTSTASIPGDLWHRSFQFADPNSGEARWQTDIFFFPGGKTQPLDTNTCYQFDVLGTIKDTAGNETLNGSTSFTTGESAEDFNFLKADADVQVQWIDQAGLDIEHVSPNEGLLFQVLNGSLHRDYIADAATICKTHIWQCLDDAVVASSGPEPQEKEKLSDEETTLREDSEIMELFEQRRRWLNELELQKNEFKEDADDLDPEDVARSKRNIQMVERKIRMVEAQLDGYEKAEATPKTEPEATVPVDSDLECDRYGWKELPRTNDSSCSVGDSTNYKVDLIEALVEKDGVVTAQYNLFSVGGFFESNGRYEIKLKMGGGSGRDAGQRIRLVDGNSGGVIDNTLVVETRIPTQESTSMRSFIAEEGLRPAHSAFITLSKNKDLDE